MDSLHLDSPKLWDEFISRASTVDLTDLLDTLPATDTGNYRRVCIEIALGDYQSALDLLETEPPLFEQGYASGLYALVRQRLGLAIEYSFATHKQGTLEDGIYGHLAWGMHSASKNPDEATQFLNQAATLATEAGMQKTLETIQTVLDNLSDPHLDLPLVAPPYKVLASPQLFDKLREDKHEFERLAALGQMYLDSLQKCRYAQYLLYNQKYDEALVIIEQANSEEFLLAYAVKMAILAALERADELSQMVTEFRPGSSEPLEAEATALGYEMCASYFAMYPKEYPLAYAYWHRAEAIAIEHKLNYRFRVIRMNLEALTNMAGDNIILDPLYETDTGDFKLKNVRNRFDSLLRAGNLPEIESYVQQNHLSKEELFLSQATVEYGRFILGEENILLVAEQITNYKPEHPTSRLYWALLMLQVFSYIGSSGGRANPERIYKILDSALSEIEQVRSVIPVAANIYPLGLSIASKFHPHLSDSDKKVALLWSEHGRDGLRRNGKKLVTITRPVREALILDEVYGTQEHYAAAIHYQTGHAENKARLERSLNEVGLKRYEIATIGGMYRGLLRLGKELDDRSILKQSEAVFESSSFLQNHVVQHALHF